MLWKHDPQDDILISAVECQDESESDDEGKSVASTSNISKSQKATDWLTQVPFIEGVTLRIYPTYYEGQLLLPKVMTISTLSFS